MEDSAAEGSILVLGVDPGLHATGYAVVAQRGEQLSALAYGVITPGERSPLPQRLRQIHEGLAALLARWWPAEVALEDFVFGNRQAAVAVGEARAVAVLAAGQAGLPVYLYKPAEVKLAVTGYGRGAKEQVQAMVRIHLGLAEPPQVMVMLLAALSPLRVSLPLPPLTVSLWLPLLVMLSPKSLPVMVSLPP